MHEKEPNRSQFEEDFNNAPIPSIEETLIHAVELLDRKIIPDENARLIENHIQTKLSALYHLTLQFGLCNAEVIRKKPEAVEQQHVHYQLKELEEVLSILGDQNAAQLLHKLTWDAFHAGLVAYYPLNEDDKGARAKKRFSLKTLFRR